MLDLTYLLTTIVFFLAMLLYVRGCNRLGHGKGSEEGSP
jgi:hypothetical protein